MPSEYRALVAKVGAFTEAAGRDGARRRGQLACRAGCASCCHVWLRVSAVEADEVSRALARLPAAERARVRARGQRELARERAAEQECGDSHQRGERVESERGAPTDDPSDEPREAAPPRCALLDDEGRCTVYEARPLVCRTQGHALRYPVGYVPISAVRRKLAEGDVTWCPLNYRDAPPNAGDVLDAERVDEILAVVAERYTRARGLDSGQRHALSALAAEHDMLIDC